MPAQVTREDVQRMMDEGAVLIDTLPEGEYAEEHIAGAVNIPLRKLDRETTAHLAKDAALIVYCYDTEWDISPRAAARLESLGFTRVYDYVGGKGDWAVHGLPLEGRTAGRRRAIDVARKDLPTCGPRERLGEVRERVQTTGHETCIVVNERGIVLGRLRRKERAGDADSAVEDVMELGPPTERPDSFLHEVIERLRKVGSLLVTWYGSEEDGGRLVGVLFREDVERVLEENERLSR